MGRKYFRVGIIKTKKVRRTNEPGDFYFTWEANVYGSQITKDVSQLKKSKPLFVISGRKELETRKNAFLSGEKTLKSLNIETLRNQNHD